MSAVITFIVALVLAFLSVLAAVASHSMSLDKSADTKKAGAVVGLSAFILAALAVILARFG